MEYQTLNLNAEVLIKFEQPGFEILAERHNDVVALFTLLEMKSANDFKEKIDENGYYKMQLWEFMHFFGAMLNNGFHGYFSNNILISSTNLKPAL